MGDLLPLQNCNYTVYDPKPDLLLPVYQFLFVVVYRVLVMMQTVRVIDVLHFPVNEPLEERIHPLRTLSTVYSHRRSTTPHSSTPSRARTDPFVMEGWDNCTDSSTSPDRSSRYDAFPVNHPEESHHQSSQSLHARNSTCTPFLSLTHRRSTCSVQTANKEGCTPSSHSRQVRRPFPSTTSTGSIHTTRAS